MKILFITNLPSPYRVDFFNELGKYCELTVCFERHTASDRDVKWVNQSEKNFKEIYAEVVPVGTDQSKGKGIIKVIKRENFDCLIISGYASPSVTRGIFYCRTHRIPYYIESDGAFYKKDSFLKRILKKFLLCGAKGHFTTCEEHSRYLYSLGVKSKKIYKYPFTSLFEKDILKERVSDLEKKALRSALGITEERVVLSVGQFIPRKGYDVLLEASREFPKDTGFYIIGGTPTEEYLAIKEKYNLCNVHFLNFMEKEQLKKWYKAADCFVFPTREDIWGVVINEAMACGLPIVTTEKCNAGLELVENNRNGFIVPINDSNALAKKMKIIIESDKIIKKFGDTSLEIIAKYTFEQMVKKHRDILNF